MNREVYEALKKRITEVEPGSETWKDFADEMTWTFDSEHPLFRVTLSDLGEDFFDIVMQMRGRNPWNIAQRACMVFPSLSEYLV